MNQETGPSEQETQPAEQISNVVYFPNQKNEDHPAPESNGPHPDADVIYPSRFNRGKILDEKIANLSDAELQAQRDALTAELVVLGKQREEDERKLRETEGAISQLLAERQTLQAELRTRQTVK